MSAEVAFRRPLLRENATVEQKRELMRHEQKRRGTVIAVVLSDDTAPSVFAYYMALARRHVEIDLRQISEKVVGATRSSLQLNVALEERMAELNGLAVERMRFAGDMLSRYGSEAEQQESVPGEIGIDADWFRQLEPDQQQIIGTVRNLRQHSELIETLASFVGTDAEAVSSLAPRTVAQATFFHALDSSRSLQTIVCASKTNERLEMHQPFPREQAEVFFAQLSKVTAEFNEVAIKSAEYVERIRSVFHTGSPKCPIPLEKISPLARAPQ